MKCVLALLLLLGCASGCAAQSGYIGFDKNVYPGDAALPLLRKTFRFTGYWLNNPPGATANTWTGKRTLLKQHGFGFLVLFNGKTYAELKGKDARALGKTDGSAAVAAAKREGFTSKVLIFLDVEEGGALLQEQANYLFAWADAVRSAGARPGVYCSAIEVPAGNAKVSTASDILRREAERAKGGSMLTLWIANDECPPAPGCAVAPLQPSAGASALDKGSIAVWQYAQSPRRKQFSADCPHNAAADSNCYAPGMGQDGMSFVDLDVADSPDPSEGR